MYPAWERYCMNPEGPLAALIKVRLNPPSSSDKTGDADRLMRTLAEMGMNDVAIPLDVLRKLPGELRENDFEARLVVGVGASKVSDGAHSQKVLDIGGDTVYGLALDLGSTTLECSLFDLLTGAKLDAAGAENPQVRFGPDVLTRVQHSMTGEFEALTRALREGVNALVEKISRRNHIGADDIYAVTVAGNTIMSHFFLGLDVNNIPLSPYIPVINRSFLLSAGEIGLSTNRNAVVYVFPNSGSYVGGDIVSGMLFSGIYKAEEPLLFIDVGTNVEVTLGCRDWIMTGAGAAGPALEGGVASIGKKAESGTISSVRIDPVTRKIDITVLSGSEPAGICGSGLIDLVSELFSAGIIDQSGRFTGVGEGIVEKEGGRAYVVYKSEDRELSLTEPEIHNFLLSKAAMFSFLYVFVRSVGLSFRDIRKVYIAGALGCGINPKSAINIGMLPDMPEDRFIPLGNASLGGAEMVLLDRLLLREVNEIAARVTYREMNEDAELMNILQGGLFLPHTEPEMLKG
jgi:uncharacterized 2Fe-2S/4Fe-4S cluster protein (DUF4445 family)